MEWCRGIVTTESTGRRCSGCDHENRAEARFCDSCGVPLVTICAACAAELRPQARFCDGCGTPVAAPDEAPAPREYTPRHLADKILNARSAVEGERKQVTVLFADIKGSLELAAAVDPEVWHAILERFFGVLAEGVHRYEGTVNQYTGDGIMALFGAPIAHEDHAQRACYASLRVLDQVATQAREVKREHGLNFSVRVGLNSGEVVVGKIGDDLRMDYTAQGLTVGLAARMEGLASPDTIYMTDATADLVSGYVDLEDLGEFAVKGVAAPMRVHQLREMGEVRTRFDISRSRGLTRFVGRDVDMQVLESALEQASQGHGGQVVGVVAEAGTGKSRLCFEFLQRCRARGLQISEGRALAHGKNVPFLPMLQVFRAYFGIDEREDARTTREKIAGRLLLLDEEFRDALPLCFELFGVPDPARPAPELDSDARQRQIFGVLQRVVQGDGTAGVAFLEDLHWIDGTSEKFLERWVDAIPQSNALLLLNFRPEYHAEWMQKSWYRQVPLAPLGPDAIEELLGDLLGHDRSLVGLAQRVHERTGGNPFYTEEVVRTLIESGQLHGEKGAYRLVGAPGSLAIPATVQSLLAARIDRLADRAKHVLQSAAVLGKEFAAPVLSIVAELAEGDLSEALSTLKDGEFIYQRALYPTAEYAFKHPLTQEVALHSQLRERRSRLHARAAQALASAVEERLDESAALIAHHWEESGEPRPAAEWHRRAAQWVRGSDPIQCIWHWQRVIAHARALPDDEFARGLLLEAGATTLTMGAWRLGMPSEEVAAISAEVRPIAEARGDREALCEVLIGEASSVGIVQGDIATYYRLGQEIAEYDDESLAVPVRLNIHIARAYSAFCYGRPVEAKVSYDRAIELAAGDPRLGFESIGYSAHALSMALSATTLAQLGDCDESWERTRSAIQFCREHELSENLAWALGNVTYLAIFRGAVPAGCPEPLAAVLEAMEIADTVGSPFSRTVAIQLLPMAQLLSGNLEACVEATEDAISLLAETRTAFEGEFTPYIARARARLQLGEAEAAAQDATRAVEITERLPNHAWGIEAKGVLARAVLARDGEAAVEEATALLRAADLWLAQSQARGFAPGLLEARAELAAAMKDDAERERLSSEALAAHREAGAVGHAERLSKQ